MNAQKWMTAAKVGAAMAGYKMLNLRRPLSVQILVTKYCNMQCDMCFTYPIDSKEKFDGHREPSFEDISSLIAQSKKLGAQVIVPFGGEPLIRDDIGRIIDTIKSHGLYCVLYTNGTHLKKRIDDIGATDQLVISVDGDEATHNSIRGKGAYARCIEAIELALSRGFNLRLHTVLTRKTLNTLPHMKYLAKKYDVMLNYGYTDATEFTLPMAEQFVPQPNETKTFLKDYLRAHDDGIRISTPKSVIKRCIRILDSWPHQGHTLTEEDMKDNRHVDIPRCGLKDRNLYVDSDGRAMPCLPLWGREDNPNAYEVGLEQAWEHYADYRPSFDGTDSPCYQCRSIFTIEKGLFYSFSVIHLLEFITGFDFLKSKRVPPELTKTANIDDQPHLRIVAEEQSDPRDTKAQEQGAE